LFVHMCKQTLVYRESVDDRLGLTTVQIGEFRV
jgi:hypothetical protein